MTTRDGRHAETRRRARDDKSRAIHAMLDQLIARAREAGADTDIIVTVRVAANGGVREAKARSITREILP